MPRIDCGAVSRILSAIEHGDTAVGGRLLPLVYEGLRRPAAQKLAMQVIAPCPFPGVTLVEPCDSIRKYFPVATEARLTRWTRRTVRSTQRGAISCAARSTRGPSLVENVQQYASARAAWFGYGRHGSAQDGQRAPGIYSLTLLGLILAWQTRCR
jgi:hypothetical protein